MPDPIVAAVVLAAGGSTRFGRPKQLLPWQGRPLVAHTVDTAWAAGLEPVVVTLGANAEEIAPALQGHPAQVLYNYRWEAGMSASLAVGLAALPPQVEAALFLPIDQPFIDARFLRALAARWQETRAGIVVPTWEGQRRSPALFSREFFPALAQLEGDVGGRALFTAHAGRIAELPLDDPLPLADADTPAAYARLCAQAESATPAELLRPIRAVIVDMDGVLWRGNEALPGLAAFFAFLEARGIAYQLATNNASRTPTQYVEKLARLGVVVSEAQVLNSAQAAADYLATRAAPGAPVYTIGGPGVPAALLSRGFRLAEGPEAEYVVVGWDREVTWSAFAAATRLILAGRPLIGTNPDRTFPTETGPVPGNGAQLALLETATGVRATVVGKPEPHLYRQALARMGAAPETTLVIGDRLDTDILGGLRLGMPTALLLSGLTSREMLAHTAVHPDLVCADLAELVAVWEESPCG